MRLVPKAPRVHHAEVACATAQQVYDDDQLVVTSQIDALGLSTTSMPTGNALPRSSQPRATDGGDAQSVAAY